MFTKKFLRDAAERVIATFVEAAAGSVILSGALNLDVAESAGLSGTMAALALLKSLLARKLGNSESAAALPKQGPFDDL